MPFTHSPVQLWDMTIHDRLRKARERKYKHAADAARAMGVKYPTYAGHENGTGGVTRKVAVRYAQFFGVDLEYLLTGRGSAPTPVGKNDPILHGEMPVKGFVQAGTWQEAYHPEGDKTIPVGEVLSHSGRRQFALEVHGESMNRQVRPGEHVICVEFDGTPRKGDIVVVERRRDGVFEATLKVIRLITSTRMELWPDSDHPDHQEPFVIRKGAVKEGEMIVIVARVIGVFRAIK